MRQFKIKNSIGTEIDLTEEQHFFSAPNGLGIEKEQTYIRAGTSFREVQNKNKQSEVSGIINFATYADYKEFADFLNYSPFTFYYKPIDTWYRRKVTLNYIDKGEMDAVLACDIKFNTLENWRADDIIFKVGQLESGAGKVYPYEYNYTYADNALGSVEIENTTINEQCCRIIIEGPAVNPSWVLTQSGAVIGDGKVNVTIENGKRLIVNSDPSSYEIALYSSTNLYEENAYDKSDFSTKRFIKVPIGKSVMSFTHEGSGYPIVYVEVSKFNELV